MKTMSDDTTQLVHELQAPLALLRTRLEAAFHTPGCSAECLKLLQRCLEEVEGMEQMVADLLLLERANLGRLAGETSAFDLSLLVTSVGQRFEPLAASRGIHYEVCAEAPLHVDGNEHQLRRVLSSLIDNAVKFTRRGGRVSVEARRLDQTVEVKVADTGPGIPPDALDRIFERFYQVDKDESREAGGVGLGLSIARALAERNRATIDVESAPGKGSTFALRIALHQ